MLNIHRNHKAYSGRGEGGQGGMEVGGGVRLYTYRYSVTTRMTPALTWAAMRGNSTSLLRAKSFSCLVQLAGVCVCVVVVIVVNRFYRALFSALEKTHCAHV